MKKTSFIKLIQLWGVIILIMIGGSIIILDFVSSYRDFNYRADQMRVNYIKRQKQVIKRCYSNDPVMANFSEYGFCGAMVKPFQIQELMDFVAKAV